jgi:hypothetical protein
MISSSYGKLVEVEGSAWLAESLAVRGRPHGTVLRHVRITFDDGPCYERRTTAQLRCLLSLSRRRLLRRTEFHCLSPSR